MLTDWQKLPETEKRVAVAAMVADFAPYDVELHLSIDPELPKKYGRAIKLVGGRYSEARGNSHQHRYVMVPSFERDLINALVRDFGFWHGARSNDTVVMIARPRHDLPAPVSVVRIVKATEDPMSTFERAFARSVLRWRAEYSSAAGWGYGPVLGPITNAEVAAAEKLRAQTEAEAEEKRRVAERLHAGMPRSLEEFDVVVEALTQFIENNLDLTDEDDEKGVLAGWKAKNAAAQALLDRCVAEICKQTE